MLLPSKKLPGFGSHTGAASLTLCLEASGFFYRAEWLLVPSFAELQVAIHHGTTQHLTVRTNLTKSFRNYTDNQLLPFL